MSAVARRYARAAVQVASESAGNEGVESLANGLRAFDGAMRQSRELREVVFNPALQAQRGPVLDGVAKKIGLSPVATRLVGLLASNGRIAVLDDVTRETEALADERLGRLRAHVTSATPLGEAQLARLTRALEKRFASPVVLSVTVDPTILGGLVCQVGDVTMDSSVRKQLEALRERLLA